MDIMTIIFPVLWVYGFYKIDRLRIGIILVIVVIFVNFGLKLLLPFPYGLVVSISMSIGLPIYFLRNGLLNVAEKLICK